MRIIPAIDIIDGKCVRLTQGDYANKKIYNSDPLEVAKSFEDAGLIYLHLVDLDGAKNCKVTNWEVVKGICANTSLHIDFGGGVKTREEAENLFQLGIRQINVGSIAVKNPSLVYHWIEEFGSEAIVLSADVKDEKIAISGWMETSSMNVFDFIRDYLAHGLRYVTCTDISTDGMLSGPNTKLYRKILQEFPHIKLIASGGVSSMDDVYELRETGVDGAIIGKAIYEGRISLEDLPALND